MKVLKIRDRIARRPSPHRGYVFKGKSLTIPGQDLTVQEILRNFVQKNPLGSESNSGYFNDVELDKYRRMDEMERLDIIREKRNEINDLRDDLKRLAHAEYDAQTLKRQQISNPQVAPTPAGDVKADGAGQQPALP